MSIAIFTGLNFLRLLVVGICYTAIIIEKLGKLQNNLDRLKERIRYAAWPYTIIVSRALRPVMLGSDWYFTMLDQAGAVEISPKAYAWIATFVLPINSALNPVVGFQ